MPQQSSPRTGTLCLPPETRWARFLLSGWDREPREALGRALRLLLAPAPQPAAPGEQPARSRTSPLCPLQRSELGDKPSAVAVTAVLWREHMLELNYETPFFFFFPKMSFRPKCDLCLFRIMVHF